MAEIEENSKAVEANVDDESGASGESAPVPTEKVIEFAKTMQTIVAQLDKHAHQIPEEWKNDPKIKQSLVFMELVKQTLDEFIRLLESPLGITSLKILWKHVKCISTFADIGAQVIIASLFVHVFQEFLDIRESEFLPAITRIKMCIDRVELKLPDIKSKVESAAHLLKQLGATTSNEKSFETTMWLFENEVRLARLDIDECKDLLCTASNKIQECMQKITAKIWIYSTARGLFLGGMCWVLHGMVKSGKVATRYAFAFGVVCSAAIVFAPVPRYRKIFDDLKKYRETQEQLMRDVNNLEKRLEDENQKYLMMQPKKVAAST